MATYNGKSLAAMARVFTHLVEYDDALRELIRSQRGRLKDIAAAARLPYTVVRRYAIGQTEAIPAADAQALYRAACAILNAKTPQPPAKRAAIVRQVARRALPAGGLLLE